MVNIDLKKLVQRKKRPLIQDVMNAVAIEASIQTIDGQMLMGSNTSSNVQHHPIRLNGDVIGWVNGNEKSEVIATLISQLAYQEFEKRKLAQELLSKYKEISLLFNLSETIIDAPDVQKVASLVLEEARQLLKSSDGALMLLQEKTLLERAAHFGKNNLFQETLPVDDNIIGNIVQTGRGKVINDIYATPQFTSEQHFALICVPLKNKDSIIGVIALSRDQTAPYSAEDLKLLTTLAFQAAGVINSLLHERQLKESRQNDLIFRLSSQIRESLELG